MAKRLNPNLVKLHRNYTVEEAADLFPVHKNTVRSWIKDGLPVCDDKRPILILGQDLRGYIQSKRTNNKRPCKLFELYCLKCRKPQTPFGMLVDYEPTTDRTGCLVGLCPDCNNKINKFIKNDQLTLISEKLDITFAKPLKHINKSSNPPLNSDFK